MQFTYAHLQDISELHDISEQKKTVLDATQSKTFLLNVWKFAFRDWSNLSICTTIRCIFFSQISYVKVWEALLVIFV